MVEKASSSNTSWDSKNSAFRLDAFLVEPQESSQTESSLSSQTFSSDTDKKTDNPRSDNSFITQDLGMSQTVQFQNAVKLDELKIEQTYIKTDVILGKSNEWGQDVSLKNLTIDYLSGMIWTSIVLGFLGVVGLVIGWTNYYYTLMLNDTPSETSQQFIDSIKTIDKTVRDMGLGFDNYDLYVNLPYDGPTAKNNLMNLTQDTTLNYLDKKKILQQSLESLTQKTLKSFNELDQAKTDIGLYGFFSKDLYRILNASTNNTSLQRSLLSLEAIKFIASIRVFSYLDTFTSQFSANAWYASSEIQRKIAGFLKRGEKDINNYLITCYLNPFETNNECNTIGDFDLFYKIIEPDSDFDVSFFKTLMRYVDIKLENTDFPSLSMMFQNFDPNSNKLSFNVEINTFQEDELQLLQKGILNPHIFVVTNLINLLKESKYILWESIDMRNLKVNKKRFKVWANEFTVNNSIINFNLPLQKTTEREIFDYKYDIWSVVSEVHTSAP